MVDDIFKRGIEEFNTLSFFEAHDSWEELWRETTGSERRFYQALIQISVGFYHLRNGNYKGSASQFGKGLSKLEQYLPVHHEIDTEDLFKQVQGWRGVAERAMQGDPCFIVEDSIPKIQSHLV